MLIETDKAVIEAFKARQLAQWERVKGALSGLQLIQSSEQGTQFMLVRSTDTFYEGVVIGQLPHHHRIASGSQRNPVIRDAPDEKKPADKRSIDLTADQVDAIIATWRKDKSALTLAFVTLAYDSSGQPIHKV